MRSNSHYLLILLAIILHAAVGVDALWAQTPVGTAFVYQGRLNQVGSPANGTYDFEFALFDDVEAGSQVGTTLIVDDLTVEDGLFSVDLDFGTGVFTGEALWLEIAVREGSESGSHTLLAPRQRISAAPFALYSDRADTAVVAESADLLDGRDSTEFLLTTGGTVTGDLVVEGSFSGELDPASLPTVTSPSAYFPARLVCGNLAESDPVQWSFITGALKITIDDTDFELTVGFSGVSTMANVAEAIQTALRATTGRLEVVTWSGDHFEIESADTTSSSSISPAISPMSAPGIDISGETAGNDWMDCDAERAQVIDSTPNPAFYEGDIPRLDSSGNIDHRFIPDTAAAVVTGQSYLIEEVSGPGRHVIEIPVGFIGVDTFELYGTQSIYIDRVGGCNNAIMATLMSIKGKVGGPVFTVSEQDSDSDCPSNPIINADLSLRERDGPSIFSGLSGLDMLICSAGQCVSSSVESISALPDGENLLVEILISEENVAVSTEWRYSLGIRYLYLER